MQQYITNIKFEKQQKVFPNCASSLFVNLISYSKLSFNFKLNLWFLTFKIKSNKYFKNTEKHKIL
jgi:hypothetical protein